MRLFRTVLVVALLILFPAVSWFYLQKGKDWRITGVTEIAEKTPVYPGSLETTDGDTLAQADLLGNFVIVADLDKPVQAEVLEALYDQFGDRHDVKLIALSPPATPPQGWTGVACAGDQCNWVRSFLMGSNNSALIDDSLRLRRTYDLGLEEDRKKIVEHTALLVPLEKRERLELRRDQ